MNGQPTGQDFYNFYNTSAGDSQFGGTIDYETPYAEIQGSGNGNFSVYSFEITPSMLDPNSSTVGTSTAADGPFYTAVGLVLSGTVHTGDTWTLELRNTPYTYTATQADATASNPLAAVALGLAVVIASQGGSLGFTASTVGNELLIENSSLGFNVGNATTDGLVQTTNSADTITTSTEPQQTNGSPVDFTSAKVTLTGNTLIGDNWTLTIGSGMSAQTAVYAVTSGATQLSDIASFFASYFGAHLTGAGVTNASGSAEIGFSNLGGGAGLPITFSVSSIAAEGYATITGTPATGELSTVPWMSESFALPANQPSGESWTVTVTPTATGSVATTFSSSADSSASALAQDLRNAFNNLTLTQQGTFHVSFSVGVLTVTSTAGPFTGTISVTPSGSATTGNVDSHTITVGTASADGWSATVSDTNGNNSNTVTASGSATASTVAQNLAAAISGVSGYHAVADGDAVTVTRLDGSDFLLSVSATPGGSAATGAASAQLVTLEPYVGQGVTLTLDGNQYNSTASTAAAAATAIGNQIGSGYTVTPVSGAPAFVVVRSNGSTISATLSATGSGTVASNGTLTLGSFNAGDTFSLTLMQARNGSSNLTETESGSSASALASAFNSGFTVTAGGPRRSPSPGSSSDPHQLQLHGDARTCPQTRRPRRWR